MSTDSGSGSGNADFLQGVAWALSVLTKGFGEPGTAAMIAAEGPFTVSDFVKAGTEECDLEEWIEELRKIEERAEKKQQRHRLKAAAKDGSHVDVD